MIEFDENSSIEELIKHQRKLICSCNLLVNHNISEKEFLDRQTEYIRFTVWFDELVNKRKGFS